MQAHIQFLQFLYFSTVVLVMSATAFAKPTETESKKAENTWRALVASLESKHAFDAKVYDGAHILFDGVPTDNIPGVSITHALSKGTARPVLIHVAILRYDAAEKRYVHRRVVCHVTLREEEIESVAEYPGSTIVRVFGKITHLDAATQIIEVQSESTQVTAAN